MRAALLGCATHETRPTASRRACPERAAVRCESKDSHNGGRAYRRIPRARVRGVRRAARRAYARAGLSQVLGGDCSHYPTGLRGVRRSPSVVANNQRDMQPVSSLPAARASHHAGAGDRRLRGFPARDRARAEVRRTALPGKTAGIAPGAAWRRRPEGCGCRGSGPAAPIAEAGARFQSGRGNRASPSCPDRPRPQARACDPVTDRPPRREAARERAQRVRIEAAFPDQGVCRGARGRREHDGRDARGERARAARGRCARSARAYGRASRVSTALTTSDETTSRGRSPSSRSQRSSSAWRR